MYNRMINTAVAKKLAEKLNADHLKFGMFELIASFGDGKIVDNSALRFWAGSVIGCMLKDDDFATIHAYTIVEMVAIYNHSEEIVQYLQQYSRQ